MKAVRFHEYGEPGVLRIEDVERPRPGAGQVLIRVAGTAFNPADGALRAGYLQGVFPLALPHIPGFDVAGTVEELGAGVTSFALGDRVFGFLPMTEDGAAAEFAIAPVEVLAAAPTSVPLADAAAVPAAALTAWQALFEQAKLVAGQRVLINGAGGGVGGYAVQFAKQAGATVIATASARSAEAVAALGADRLVDYTSTTLADALGEPVDVLVNLVATDEAATAALVGLVASGGVLVSATAPAPADEARAVRSVRVQVRSDPAQLAEIAGRIDAGAVRLDVSASLPLSDVALVHERAAAGQIRGKVVLVPTV